LIGFPVRGSTAPWAAEAPGVSFGLAHIDIDDVVKTEPAPGVKIHTGQRHDAAVGQADADRVVALLAAALLHDYGRRPMHVVERQAQVLQRLLPGRRPRRGCHAVELLNRVGEIGFWARETVRPEEIS
jgi:hypothetical protein